MSMNLGSEGGGQDFDLNLAPIIDCLTVLITFMLASASFLSIGILDAGVAAAGATASDTHAPPPVNIAVELGENQKVTIRVTGKSSSTTPIGKSGTERDFVQLTKNLESIKARWPAVNAVTLTAENHVEYRDVVKSMEIIRKTMPVVLLGGF